MKDLTLEAFFFEDSEIYISAKYEGTLYKKELQDDFGRINFYLLPFVKASQVRRFFPDSTIENYDQAVRTILENASIDENERNILVAHQFVAGKSEPLLSGSEGLSVKNVGLVEMISPDSMDKFDYVALGHIHSPQKIGREEIRYAGSPLKYSLSEVNSRKYATIVTLEDKGKTDIELVELTPMRDLRHIKGKMADLLDDNVISDCEDYMYVTLTDEDMIGDVMSIVQQYYPNTVKIDYDNKHTKELRQLDITNITDDKSFDEVISDFYQKMYGCDISEDEISIMKEIAGEAGVLNEAD